MSDEYPEDAHLYPNLYPPKVEKEPEVFRPLDVGESPEGESAVLCAATIPGTMSICTFPAMMKEGPDGKMVPVTIQIEGGNRGSGFNVPMCSGHLEQFRKNPASIEFAIPPSIILPNRPMR